MMKLFHGCNQDLITLKYGTYVTKNIKESYRFAYRRAVEHNSTEIFIMECEIDESQLIRDNTRDRAFILQTEVTCQVIDRCYTYDSPYKLTNFKKGNK